MKVMPRLTHSVPISLFGFLACSEPMSPPGRPAVQAAPSATAGYTITDIGTLGGGFGCGQCVPPYPSS